MYRYTHDDHPGASRVAVQEGQGTHTPQGSRADQVLYNQSAMLAGLSRREGLAVVLDDSIPCEILHLVA